MSDGALTQLAAIGAQDFNFLSDDLDNSLFKETEKKINNCCKATFSMYPFGKASWGTTTRFKIQKKGDLLGSIYFVVKLPKKGSYEDENGQNKIYDKWVDYIGNVLIENVKLYIGGQLIDEQTGEFMQIYSDLKDDDWNKNCMIGHSERMSRLGGNKDDFYNEPRSDYVYVPLKFWFCESYEKYLPLIALQYHDVEIEIKIREASQCLQLIKTGDPSSSNEDKELDTSSQHIIPPDSTYSGTGNKSPLEDVRLDCNYVLLDTEERKRIAQKDHEILITQTQRISKNLFDSMNISLTFNHPVKEMFWYIQNSLIKNKPDPFNFSTGYDNYMDKQIYDFLESNNITHNTYYRNYTNKVHWMYDARILINGQPIVDWKDYRYFYYLQNYENYRNKLEHFIYLYSFCDNPKSKTPTGSLNFSRINEAELQISTNGSSIDTYNDVREQKNVIDYKHMDNFLNVHIYAVNYNYLIIKGGMAGLKYKC